MIDKATVKKILDSANIVEVVSDYVHLTKRGANYVGLCPFHNERTPSFSVSPARGICHCFSCGKGGSPVNFIMEKEGINFHDALLHLAKKYGIKVEERQLTDAERAEQSKRESMLVANEWAMQQFEHNLTTQEGSDVALSYLYSRGVTQAAISRFHLGYALDAPSPLYDAAMRKGFDADTLTETGLCGKDNRDGRPYDRFRGRVIFPVLSPSGKVIAFGGRGIKGEPAKYINSPESLIYRKSNELYGIFQAKNAIVRNKKCYLVEGYMDVIGMWQSGMENTVASSGTSLTDGQIALIHRFTDNVTLIYDGDAAGIKASLRGIDLLLSHKLNVKVLLLPDGDDPDSFSRKHSPEEFRRYIDEHEEDFIAFKTRILLTRAGSGSAVERTEAVRSIVASIASIPDMVQRAMYIQETARVMNVSERILTIEVGKALEGAAVRLRQRREISRLQAQEGSQQPDQATAPSAEQKSSQRPETAVDSRLIDASSKTGPRRPAEKAVIDYVIRFGMLPFCALDEESDHYLNVAQYVQCELEDDGITLSTPVYAKALERVLSLVDRYESECDAMLAEMHIRQKEEAEQWYREIAEQGLSMSEIESREAKYAKEQEEACRAAVTRFAEEYVGHVLGSDPDDELRHLVLGVITPRYTLSKYHSKNVHIATDAERIGELVPRAINELKDVLLTCSCDKVQEELRAAAGAGDTDKINTLILKLQQISNKRCALARTIGERIVTPRQ